MQCWNILDRECLLDMHYVSYRVMVFCWRIIVHTLCNGDLLFSGLVTVHDVLCWDICGYDWDGVVHSLCERVIRFLNG